MHTGWKSRGVAKVFAKISSGKIARGSPYFGSGGHLILGYIAFLLKSFLKIYRGVGLLFHPSSSHCVHPWLQVIFFNDCALKIVNYKSFFQFCRCSPSSASRTTPATPAPARTGPATARRIAPDSEERHLDLARPASEFVAYVSKWI